MTFVIVLALTLASAIGGFVLWLLGKWDWGDCGINLVAGFISTAFAVGAVDQLLRRERVLKANQIATQLLEQLLTNVAVQAAVIVETMEHSLKEETEDDRWELFWNWFEESTLEFERRLPLIVPVVSAELAAALINLDLSLRGMKRSSSLSACKARDKHALDSFAALIEKFEQLLDDVIPGGLKVKRHVSRRLQHARTFCSDLYKAKVDEDTIIMLTQLPRDVRAEALRGMSPRIVRAVEDREPEPPEP